jgi:hypothetical protein
MLLTSPTMVAIPTIVASAPVSPVSEPVPSSVAIVAAVVGRIAIIAPSKSAVVGRIAIIAAT